MRCPEPVKRPAENAENDPEVEATYQLWLKSHQALLAAAGGTRRGGMGTRAPRCQAVASFTAEQTPYPTAEHRVVDQDTNNTLRPWMAVVAYLMSDARVFLQ